MLSLPLLIPLNTAEAINGIVTQAAEHARAINLRRQVLYSRRWMGCTAVHGSLLAGIGSPSAMRLSMRLGFVQKKDTVGEWYER